MDEGLNCSNRRGKRTKLSRISYLEKEERIGIPNELVEIRWVSMNTMPDPMPIKPIVLPINRKKNLQMMMNSFRLAAIKPVTAVNATMMTIGAPTMPALTAASPMISEPTIVMAEPTALGALFPLPLEAQT